MKLAYSEWPANNPETARREAVVLLHGMGGTGRLWRPIAAELEDDFRVIAPDQRGHGGSQNPPNDSYDPQTYGKDVLELLDALGIEKAWWVGHSMGVRTALAACSASPERSNGVAIVDLGLEGQAGGGLGPALEDFLRVLPDSYPSRDEARTQMIATCPDPSIVQYLLAVSELKEGKVTFPFDREALLKTIAEVKGLNLRPWIETLLGSKTPVLALRGGESRVWSAPDFELERQKFESQGMRFHTVEGTGHGLPFEKRKEFVRILKGFFST